MLRALLPLAMSLVALVLYFMPFSANLMNEAAMRVLALCVLAFAFRLGADRRKRPTESV